jgi:glycosyltransferase involved in cell wall biosynthesis/GT2 family glycosyltransferase
LTADDGVIARLTQDIAWQDAQIRERYVEQARLAIILTESESRRIGLGVSLAEAGLQIEALRHQLDEARSEARCATDEAAALRQMRNALVTSASWRVTAPLRATTAHLPAGVRRSLRRMARLSYWLMTPHRIPLRLAQLRAQRLERDLLVSASPMSLLTERPSVSVAASDVGTEARLAELPAASPAPVFWLQSGDLINWLRHEQAEDELGKAVRAIAELFLASFGGTQPLLPCLLNAETLGTPGKLARLPSLEAALYIASRIGSGRFAELVATARLPAPLSVEQLGPRAGDHLLFPALVWEPIHGDLFRQLTGEGMRISILLHDLVPIEPPDTVSPEQRDAFLNWLRMALAQASLVFVPTETVRDGLQKFVILARWQVAGDIVVAPFGTPNAGQACTNPYRSLDEASADFETIRRALLRERPPEDPASQPLARRIFGDQPRSAAEAAFARARLWCSETDPEVSIVIVNRHAGPRTVECLRAIWANTEGLRYEVLVADNDSGEGDIALLRCLGDGVRILDLGCDRYFGEANNIAAEQARGRYLCLLDNAAVVQPGWLHTLHDALAAEPEAGVAGPCFLNPDGSIREAGAMIDAFGYPVPAERGHAGDSASFQRPHAVDYISAATLLMPRALYLRAGGCDLAYEPARYEDVDLCFKSLALGRRSLYCPEAHVIQSETAAMSSEAEAQHAALGDLNRAKFLSRWGSYLASRCAADLQPIVETVIPRGPESRPDPEAAKTRRKVVLYTPYFLTPGGGERYLLSFAAALSADAAVTIVTPHPYSYLRLDTLGREFGLDLSQCWLETWDEFLRKPVPSFMLTMGNHILPPIDARGVQAIYLCQFPFTLLPQDAAAQGSLDGYHSIIAYSDYAKAHIAKALSANQLRQRPVTVLYPPVPFMGDLGRPKKRNMILNVGRFFVGGHSKRQDLLIAAFRTVAKALPKEAAPPELHLAGSSMPTAENIEYLALLRRHANGLRVFFHVNVAPENLAALYQEAEIYWHGTGLGTDLEQEPEKAEHFGISLVEAMSAGCIVFAHSSGGPREIITEGVDGFLYSSTEDLAQRTHRLLSEEGNRRQAVRRAAERRAADFSISRFNSQVRGLLDISLG